jgi:transcriptional regulator with XRE-family HTH domain
MSRKVKSKQKVKELESALFKLKMANFIKDIRKAHNLKQTEMSARLGVTQGTISKIESGVMAPDLATYLKFKKEFMIDNDNWSN